MARPIFGNEILETHNGSNEPQYDITHGGGTIANAILTLKNAISQSGTPINADNMNNLFDFDNLDSMRGNISETILNSNGTITENISIGSVIVATRLTEFPTASTIRETTTVYDDTGTITLRRTIINTTVASNRITQEVI